MENKGPIKRSKNLVLLSRDHHEGLLIVWKIRQGIRLAITIERMKDFVVNAFEKELEPHFLEEENYVFSKLQEEDDLRIRAENDHATIRTTIATYIPAAGISIADLEAFADLIEAHIRFEERTLFPHIEQKLSPEILAETGAQLEAAHQLKQPFTWHDEFWLKPKE